MMAIEDVFYNADGSTQSYRINGQIRQVMPLTQAEKNRRLAIEQEKETEQNITQSWMKMVETFDNEALVWKPEVAVVHGTTPVGVPERVSRFVDIRYFYGMFALLIVLAIFGVHQVVK
jgi:hypothetical protein